MQLPYTRLLIAASIVGASLSTTALAFRHHLTIGVQRDGSVVVPNGQLLTPSGTHIEVYDRPLGMVLGPNRRTLAAWASGPMRLWTAGSRSKRV